MLFHIPTTPNAMLYYTVYIPPDIAILNRISNSTRGNTGSGASGSTSTDNSRRCRRKTDYPRPRGPRHRKV